MVTVERIRDDSEKRILRCSEGNRVWYQMWITDIDMYVINKFFHSRYECGDIKYWWLSNLQFYYVFFYEKKGSKVRGVLGKENTNYILNSIL